MGRIGLYHRPTDETEPAPQGYSFLLIDEDGNLCTKDENGVVRIVTELDGSPKPLFDQSADPAAILNGVMEYAKKVDGVSQKFVRLSDGTVLQVGAGGGGAASVLGVPIEVQSETTFSVAEGASSIISAGGADLSGILPGVWCFCSVSHFVWGASPSANQLSVYYSQTLFYFSDTGVTPFDRLIAAGANNDNLILEGVLANDVTALLGNLSGPGSDQIDVQVSVAPGNGAYEGTLFTAVSEFREGPALGAF